MDVTYVPRTGAADSAEGAQGTEVAIVTTEERLNMAPDGFTEVFDSDFQCLMYWDGSIWCAGPGVVAIHAPGAVDLVDNDVALDGECWVFGRQVLATYTSEFYSQREAVDGFWDFTGLKDSIEYLYIQDSSTKVYARGCTIDTLQIESPYCTKVDLTGSSVDSINLTALSPFFDFSDPDVGFTSVRETVTQISIQSNSNYQSLNLENFTALAAVISENNTQLTDITPPLSGFTNPCYVVVQNCPVTVETIDAIFAACHTDRLGSVYVIGEGVPAPSVSAAAKIADLITAGWVIVTN